MVRMMNDKSYYEREKTNTKTQIDSKNNENAALQAKINRLNEVKQTLITEKALFASVKSACKSVIETPEVWKGKNRSDFDENGYDLVQLNETFFRDIDSALDAVNNEITRYENTIASNRGILGRLWSYFNSLANTIENWTN